MPRQTKQSGDRLLCAFVAPIALNAEFKEWPLHVTVMPWFRTPASSAQLAQLLTLNFEAVQPFEAEVGSLANFGAKNELPVNLIEQPTPFAVLEQMASLALVSSGVQLVSRRFRPYRPHVTVQKHAHAAPGDTFQVDKLHIIEQRDGYKNVVGEVLLGNG